MSATSNHFKLTALREDILNVIKAATKPLKAYQILEALQSLRPNAKPPTVYRVLDFLVAKGVLHHIKSMHSYALCQVETPAHHCEQHGENIDIIFICQQCDHYTEINDPVFSVVIHELMQKKQFHLKEHTIELPGTCQQCTNLTKD